MVPDLILDLTQPISASTQCRGPRPRAKLGAFHGRSGGRGPRLPRFNRAKVEASRRDVLMFMQQTQMTPSFSAQRHQRHIPLQSV